MSDDEEVILVSSELHKYIEKGNLDALIFSNDLEKDQFSHPGMDKFHESSVCNSCEIPVYEQRFFKRPVLCVHTTCLISTILETGLMYPDHVVDVNIYLNTGNFKSEPFYYKRNFIFYSSILLGSAASMLLFYKKVKPFHIISIFAGSLYCTYKIYEDINLLFERKKIRWFADVLEQLFSITKKSLSFIFETEFILKTKILKEQELYVPYNSRNSCNTAEGVEHTGLLLLELRHVLGEIFVDVTITFKSFTRYMRTYLRLLPHFDSDDNYTELPDDETLHNISLNSSIEDLKRLQNFYFIAQSEFLRRLVLSLVKDFWQNSDLQNYRKALIIKINDTTNSFLEHINILQSFYERCRKINGNKHNKIKRNKLVEARNASERLLIFAKHFLTKADARILALSLDLKMIDDWINECEVNDKESYDSKKLFTIFQDRLDLMKSNIESFNDLYNDNYFILKNMMKDNSFIQEVVDDSANLDEKLADGLCKTGIEVGKSDFNFSGEDEVLISLSNNDFTSYDDNLDYDYEEGEIQKCLPINVLLELKCALKGKKEEWIEREKKALKSDSCIQNLDLDTLSNFSVENHEDISSSKDKIKKNNSVKLNNSYDYDSDCSDYNDHSSYLKKNMSWTKCDDYNCNPDDHNKEASLSSCKTEVDSSHENRNCSKDSSVKTCHSSFIDQIKSAQKSFSLSLKEEEFINDISDSCSDN